TRFSRDWSSDVCSSDLGAGPAGLAAAHFLARKGYQVTIFERWALPGGVMAYGIPEFVLPQKVIDAEVRRIQAMGVEIRTGVSVGEDVTIDQLFEQGYSAVFIGIGANEPSRLGIEGEDQIGRASCREREEGSGGGG